MQAWQPRRAKLNVKEWCRLLCTLAKHWQVCEWKTTGSTWSTWIYTQHNKQKKRQENMMRHISPLAWQVQPWERPQRLECLKILAPDSMKQKSKTKHWDCTSQTERKPVDFFRKKLLSCHAQQSCLTKAASVSGNAQFPSCKAAYRLVRRKKTHTVAEELILPSATDMVPTIIDETAASKLKAMPLSKTTKSPLMLPLQWLFFARKILRFWLSWVKSKYKFELCMLQSHFCRFL